MVVEKEEQVTEEQADKFFDSIIDPKSLNEKEYVKWLKRRAKQGIVKCQHELAEMYEYGDRVKKNYTLAARWYRKAANQGHSKSQKALGNAYSGGYGVKKNIEKAIIWFTKAANIEDVECQMYLADMYEYGYNGVKADYKKSYKWYKKAADSGNEKAKEKINGSYFQTMMKLGEN